MRILRWATLTAAAFAALVLLGLWLYGRASLPTYRGVQSVAGLQQVVQIERDADGVPRVVARTETDAAFGLGFVHAQDRLWQMEVNRRIAAGRLAEIFGAAASDTDRFTRTLGVRLTAERIYNQSDDVQRAWLDSYARGVNAFLQSRRGPLPPEFALVGAPPPEPWSALDSIGWSLMMAWDLAQYSMTMELRRLQLAGRFSVAEINDLYPPPPGETSPQTTDYVGLYRELAVLPRVIAEEAHESTPRFVAGGFGDAAVGSNAWVVSAERSVSRMPLLANDPHLGLTTPPVWYFAALSAPGLDVIGATLPGLPGVLLGRNQRIAWAFANAGVDQQDLYLERINPDNPDEYETPAGWAPFGQRSERIRVKGAPDVELSVRTTRHGPVLSGLAVADRTLAPGPYVLALRWSALEGVDRSVGAVVALNRATNIDEAEAALARFDLVSQVALLADVDGHIGQVLTGNVPVRAANNDLQGIAPSPGWDARFDWQGFMPTAEKPRLRNPPGGVIVAANHRFINASYRHHLTHDWFWPYRAQRIARRLDERAAHDLGTFAALQADVVSPAAQQLMTLLRDVEPGSAVGREALARLQRWDGAMSATAAEPLLFHTWMRELKRRIFADDFGPLAERYVDSADRTTALIHVLSGRARGRDWCDDRATPHRIENCLALAADALDDAMTALAQRTGRDLAGMRWGDEHVAVQTHRPLSNVRFLSRWFEHRIAYPGDTYTINVGALSHAPNAPFETRHAASMRALYDLADLPRHSLWIHSGGQSGHPMAAGFSSLLVDWRDVKYRALRPAAAPSATLELRPAGPP